MSAGDVVVITGCSDGGIGAALCVEYAHRGYQVFASARNVSKMASLESVRGIERVQADINDEMSLKKMIAQVLSKTERIDVLVCNAGVGASGALLDIPLNNVQNAFKTNVTGTLATCQAAIPSMARKGKGKVVIIGSVVGIQNTPWAGTYCATKSAVHALANVLRIETKPLGIQVSVVCPGGIRSNIATNQLVDLQDPPEESMYADSKVQAAIRARASFSQRPDSTPSSVFAKSVVDMSERHSLPAYYYSGKGSTLLWFLGTLLPYSISDALMARNFGLDNLKPITKTAC